MKSNPRTKSEPQPSRLWERIDRDDPDPPDARLTRRLEKLDALIADLESRRLGRSAAQARQYRNELLAEQQEPRRSHA